MNKAQNMYVNILWSPGQDDQRSLIYPKPSTTTIWSSYSRWRTLISMYLNYCSDCHGVSRQLLPTNEMKNYWPLYTCRDSNTWQVMWSESFKIINTLKSPSMLTFIIWTAWVLNKMLCQAQNYIGQTIEMSRTDLQIHIYSQDITQ